MTYRNEILCTVSVRLPLVSLVPLVRLSFQSIRNVLRSDHNGLVRLFAASCFQSCRGWSDHLPGSLAGGARLRHPQGRGKGCGGDKGGRGEALGAKREKERKRGRDGERGEQQSTAATGRKHRRRGGRQQLSDSLTHMRARNIAII
ncbi:hypothetical protein CesoFtcFv8_024917 [Champsocephalus esox]|uniref:Uncharacterized protein n=2 Tax=Champsocephalus TaxID=52236 RepID=A0AAN8C9L1_CHAGU|nr:hypothetical protein CesoFtcFv8_024917 [Champsocephalus esox]KAK5898365.1 hypothetical protein CgunFtcFv8_015789 [Champsocephalus gunnari]